MSFSRLIALALIGLFLTGCTTTQSTWSGPATSAAFSVEAWEYEGFEGRILKTPRYHLHTTIADERALHRLVQVMEGAYAQYQQFAGRLPSSDRPMRGYVFETREQWVHFTRRHTGAAASIYLQIPRGGYSVNDWFVSYFVGNQSTYAVAAHEGWHQFVARHFRNRLPPFLEEGIACMFESVQFHGGLPRWDWSINAGRTLSLRNSIDMNKLWTLEELISMHAGDVVRLPRDRIEAFYAQSWAFARFLYEGQDGAYREALNRMLSDAAGGRPPMSHISAHGRWSPRAVKPALEHYLGKDLAKIETEFRAYMRHLAYDQFNRQWSSRPDR